MGTCFEFGEGIEQNDERAFKCYEEAANQGHERSQYRLANCYENGIGTPKDFIKAFYWYKQASIKRISSSTNFISDML